MRKDLSQVIEELTFVKEASALPPDTLRELINSNRRAKWI
jgi:hypothetical protein